MFLSEKQLRFLPLTLLALRHPAFECPSLPSLELPGMLLQKRFPQALCLQVRLEFQPAFDRWPYLSKCFGVRAPNAVAPAVLPDQGCP